MKHMRIASLLAAIGAILPAPAAQDGNPLPTGSAPLSSSALVFAPEAGADVADALQALIDANPNRTIYIPDGTWLLSHPVATPAKPTLAVSLHLADFAILKAAPDFPSGKPLVRLGGIHPANDIRTPGSVYGLFGGIIDGSGTADGVTIESGRETRIQNVSMKNVRIGLRVLRGANNGSSDCDIRDVNIVCNQEHDSVGLLVEAHDNSFSNMRIWGCVTGVRIRGGGNRFYNIHPLWGCPMKWYEESVAFDDAGAANTYICSYADKYMTGWLFRKRATNYMIQCIVIWVPPSLGTRHVAIRCEGQFHAVCTGMSLGFLDLTATNTVLIAEPGGSGVIRDPIFDEKLLNDPGDAFRDYWRK